MDPCEDETRLVPGGARAHGEVGEIRINQVTGSLLLFKFNRFRLNYNRMSLSTNRPALRLIALHRRGLVEGMARGGRRPLGVGWVMKRTRATKLHPSAPDWQRSFVAELSPFLI